MKQRKRGQHSHARHPDHYPVQGSPSLEAQPKREGRGRQDHQTNSCDLRILPPRQQNFSEPEMAVDQNKHTGTHKRTES